MRYCISDIHGCSKTLLALIDKLSLTSSDTVYFLGDYVDRGPDSKGVLDIIMSMNNAVCHKGNHEDMMINAIYNQKSQDVVDHWMVNGGSQTINSFCGKFGSQYLDFLKNLKLITELPDFYLCHAGISSVLKMQTPEKIVLWDRDCVINTNYTGGRKLVCGHTPTKIQEIKKLSGNKIVIDGGCVFKNNYGYGNLVALSLDDMKIFTQKNID